MPAAINVMTSRTPLLCAAHAPPLRAVALASCVSRCNAAEPRLRNAKEEEHADAQAGYPVAMLTEQYRMHPDISAWPSHFFYEGRIQDHAALKRQRCVT